MATSLETTSGRPTRPADPTLVLAVDAGGTKTAAWLARSEGAGTSGVLGRGRASCGNPLTVGFDAATRAIADAVAEARQQAARRTEPVASAVLSVAGAREAALRHRLIHWARETGQAAQVSVVTDALPVLAAATDDCCGVGLIAGTGSVAFGRSADGRTTLCGGWGYVLGDDGSGFAIGRAAVRLALEDLETGGPRQPLTRAVLEQLGAQSVPEIEQVVYEHPVPRSAVAAVAPRLIEAAEAGDAAAVAVVDAAAADLARLVQRAARAIGVAQRPFPLAVAGGAVVGSPRLRQRLAHHLEALRLPCTLRLVTEPLEGCLRLARQRDAESLLNADWG